MNPKSVLLIDSSRTELLKKHLLQYYEYNEVNKPSLKDVLFAFLKISSILTLVRSFFIFKNIRSAFVYTHFYNAIQIYRPKVVIGFYIVMKRKYFFYLANEFNDIEFIGIAPSRLDSMDKLINISPSRAKFFVHGYSDFNELAIKGYDESLIFPNGSFYSHVHSKKIESKCLKYDICILSQYLHHFDEKEMTPDRKIQLKIFNLMMDYVSRFSKENPQLKIAIAMRPQERGQIGSDLEKKYFQEKLRNINPVFINSNELEGSSYKAAINSKIILTHYSTLAYELLGFKKKVLFFQPYEFKYAPIPSRIKWKVMRPKYKVFQSQLNDLLNIKYSLYEESIKKDAKYFNNMENNLIETIKLIIDQRITHEKDSE